MRLHSGSVKPHLLAAVVLTGLSAGALAEAPQDRYWVGLEYFYPTITSTAKIDATATARPGSSIRLEDELDLDERKGTPYLNLGLRVGDNWRLEFEYYALKRDASKIISRQIDFGDASFPVGVQLDTEFNSTVYRLTTGWSFYKDQQAEAGLGFGLHVTDFELQLSGVGTGAGGTAFRREAHDALVPLPTIGLYGSYFLMPEVQLRARVDYLSLEYKDYDGRLTNWMAAVDWRFHKNVAVGVGYRYVDYKLESTKSDFLGEVKYTFKGPTIFINAGF
jgi:Outer membrane protein beta-barrel domain